MANYSFDLFGLSSLAKVELGPKSIYSKLIIKVGEQDIEIIPIENDNLELDGSWIANYVLSTLLLLEHKGSKNDYNIICNITANFKLAKFDQLIFNKITDLINTENKLDIIYSSVNNELIYNIKLTDITYFKSYNIFNLLKFKRIGYFKLNLGKANISIKND